MSDVGPARSQPGSDYQTDPSSSEALSQSQESDCFLKLQTCLNMANMDEADDLFDGSDLRDLETLLQEKEHSLEKAIVSAHCLKFITKSSDKAPAISFSRSPAFKHFMDLVAIYGKDEQFRSFAIQTIRNLGEIPDVIPCMGEHSDTIAALSSDLSAIFKVHSSPKAEHVPPPQEESTFAVPVRTSQGLPNTNLRVTVPRTSISSTSSGRSSINSRLSHFDSPLITPSRKSAPQLSTPTALSTPSGHSDTSSKQGEGSPVSTPVPSSEGGKHARTESGDVMTDADFLSMMVGGEEGAFEFPSTSVDGPPPTVSQTPGTPSLSRSASRDALPEEPAKRSKPSDGSDSIVSTRERRASTPSHHSSTSSKFDSSSLLEYQMNLPPVRLSVNSDPGLLAVSQQLTATAAELEEEQKKLAEQINENSALKDSVDQLNTVKQALETRLQRGAEQLRDLEERLRASEARATESDTALQSTTVEFRARAELAATESARTMEQLKNAKQQLEIESKDARESKSKFAELRASHLKLIKAHEEATLDLQKKSTEFEKLQQQATNQLDEAGKLYHAKTMLLKTTVRDLKEAKAALQSCRLELDNSVSDLKSQTALKTQFQTRVQTLDADCTKLENSKASLQLKLKDLSAKFDSTEKELRSTTQMKQSFMNQLIEKKEELQHVQEKLQKERGQISQQEQMMSEFSELQKQAGLLKTRLFDESEANSNLRQEFERCRSENRELLSYVDQLLKELGK
eukprot:9310_1